jgi:low affinity Fe/Cu permease
MPKIRIDAEISEEHLRAYEGEAKRQGVTVEQLVEKTVNVLLEELEQEEKDGGCPMRPA